jgi:hypothetical protein
MEDKMSRENEKWEGGNETLSHVERERERAIHTLMAYISGPAGVGNDSTTPNSTTADTTHAVAFM